jgi:hypothetical protein
VKREMFRELRPVPNVTQASLAACPGAPEEL